MGIISISGKISSGKDTVGEIIQIITDSPHFTDEAVLSFIGRPHLNPRWEVKRFADKLKDIVCMLLGCTRKQLEVREFKEKELGEEWWYWKENITCKIIKSYTGYETNDYNLVKLTPRLLLQLLGTEAGRQIIHPNIWLNALMSEYKNLNPNFSLEDGDALPVVLREKYPNWIVTDTRFPNELEAVKDKGGITIRVNRKPWINADEYEVATGKKVEKVAEHESETSLDNAEFDYTIDNNGTLLELVGKVREILTKENII